MDQADNRRSNVTPAPYGQACTNCARAKYRCLYRSDRRKCERCHRLQKECVPSVSTRKLAGKHRIGPRAADLEEKIENLTALLKSQAAEKVRSHASPPPVGTRTPAPSGDFRYNRGGNDSSIDTDASPELAGPGNSDLLTLGESTYYQRSQLDNLMSAFGLQPHQAEDCLTYFRSHMLSLFPFVFLRPEMTARQLRELYPFLWVNIMAVTVNHVTGQNVFMTDSIKHFVAQKIVVDNEANLDFLLGLLVFICWFHFHHTGKLYITVMTSLAYSVIADMKLNQGPIEAQNSAPWSQRPHRDAKTAAGRRAMLAYFLLVSQISHSKKGIDVPEWTPHLDGCLQTISQYPEWPGDEQLAAQVKIQLIVDQIGRTLWKNQDFQQFVSYTGGLQSQLDRIKAQLPRDLTQNASITYQLLYSELAIQETVLNKPPISLYSPNYQRHQLLEAHLTTIARSFDQFFAMPQDQYPGVTFTRWCKMAHGLILLHRLYVLDDASWNPATARERVDLFALGDRLASILAEIGGNSGDAPSTTDGNMFIGFSRMIRSMCSAWWADVQSSERRQQSGDHHRQWQSLWTTPNIEADTEIRGELAHGGMAPMPASELMSDDVWLNELFCTS